VSGVTAWRPTDPVEALSSVHAVTITPVVVDVLSLFHGAHHRRARVGGNFAAVIVAMPSMTRTRA